MKKILFAWSAILLASCSGSMKDEGVKNAEQFVKEKRFLNMDNIESVDGVVQDSLLGLTHITFAGLECSNTVLAYYDNNMTKSECMAVIDSLDRVVKDAYYNWKYNGVNNDELHEKYEYRNCWKKVINVTIKYKSQTTESVRVIMDKDGITPWMTDEEIINEIVKVQSQLNQEIY